VRLACGHMCAGCFGHSECPPCLDCLPDPQPFCSICWVEELRAGPCLKLGSPILLCPAAFTCPLRPAALAASARMRVICGSTLAGVYVLVCVCCMRALLCSLERVVCGYLAHLARILACYSLAHTSNVGSRAHLLTRQCLAHLARIITACCAAARFARVPTLHPA
jgi:hypothetical protein